MIVNRSLYLFPTTRPQARSALRVSSKFRLSAFVLNLSSTIWYVVVSAYEIMEEPS